MRIITCRPGHSVEIKLKTPTSPQFPAYHLFAHESIEIFVGRVKEHEIKLAVMAPRQFTVLHNYYWC